MTPADLLLVVMWAALSLYAVLGGADFGAGIWEFTTLLRSSEAERQHLYRAIGPVWEANHVWLIFVLVILLNGFPLAFAALSRALWLPLLVALCGIVFRGASYVFRSYGRGSAAQHTAWESAFAMASTVTPFFLGASAGAIASGQLQLTDSGEYTASYLTGWMSPMAVFAGFYLIGACAYLAAVYLTREAGQTGDEALLEIWRRRALATGLWVGLLSLAGLAMVWLECPQLATGFTERAWPLVAASVVCGITSLIALWRHCDAPATVAAGAAVATVIWGWGVAQYPHVVPPQITSEMASAPDNVQWAMLAVIALGTVMLLPALTYLLLLFKSS